MGNTIWIWKRNTIEEKRSQEDFDKDVMNNKRLLYNCMIIAGFTNLLSE